MISEQIVLTDKQLAYYNYIAEHVGMPASPSVVGRAVDPNYSAKDYSNAYKVILVLKYKEIIVEIKGRYYTTDKQVMKDVN